MQKRISMIHSHINKINNSTLIALFFLVLFVLSSSILIAQNQLPDSIVIERTQYIQKMLDQGKSGSKLWWNMWLYGYTAGTLVQGAVFFSSDELKTRQDMILGAATSVIGAVGQLVMPMVPASAPKKLALIPGDTEAERILKLKKAEELFKASAEREIEGRSWKMHAFSGAVNLSSGMITWLGFKRTFWAGLGNFALNTVVTEVQIWTQPTRAIKDYKKYCEMYKNGLPYSSYKPRTHFYVNACPQGLAVRIVF
jgi:hypothetical protein